MKIAIVENSAVQSRFLKDQIHQWSVENQNELNIDEFSSGEEVLSAPFLDFDLIFMDIQMGELTGIATARRLREEQFAGEIVFLTSFSEYVFDGYGVKALSYLIKPARYDKISKCLDYLIKHQSNDIYTFQHRGEYIQIPFSKILYFSSNKHYLQIVTAECEFRQLETLKQISSYLPSQFKFCHRTTIVNMNHVLSLKGKELSLSNNVILPVSNTYLQDIRSAFFEFVNNLR